MCFFFFLYFFFLQAEDGIRDLVRSRGLGDVYKRQVAARVTRSRVPSLVRSRAVMAPSPRPSRMTGMVDRLSLIHI